VPMAPCCPSLAVEVSAPLPRPSPPSPPLPVRVGGRGQHGSVGRPLPRFAIAESGCCLCTCQRLHRPRLVCGQLTSRDRPVANAADRACHPVALPASPPAPPLQTRGRRRREDRLRTLPDHIPATTANTPPASRQLC